LRDRAEWWGWGPGIGDFLWQSSRSANVLWMDGMGKSIIFPIW
jgi:prepilin-type processing-associated H-X9-DG protein